MRTRINVFALASVASLAAVCGVSCVPPSNPTDPKEKEPDGLVLRLSADPEQSRDEIRVELTVINRTEGPIGWDSEFSAGVMIQAWSSTPPADEGPRLVHGYSVRPLRSRDRFVVLPQGEQLAKEFVITQPMRRLTGAMGHTRDKDPVVVAAEIGYDYSIPEGLESITVGASYDLCWHDYYRAIFRWCYGFWPDEVNMFINPCPVHSNEVQIRLR